MTIRNATVADVPHLLALERMCSSAAHWTEQLYEAIFDPNRVSGRLVLVAEGMLGATGAVDGSDLTGTLGFLVARHLPPEWELENIVVAPAVQHQGIGKQLLETLIARARETDSDAIFLEVRESNKVARSLYERCGFQPTGRRRAYYANPAEDALLYRTPLL